MVIWLAVLRGKSFITGCYTQACEPNFFIPAIFIGTVDFYHFIPGGHKVSEKQKQLAYFSRIYLIRMKFDVVMEEFKLNIPRWIFIKTYRNKGNNSCFTDCVKKL